jgi:hypothetical protein
LPWLGTCNGSSRGERRFGAAVLDTRLPVPALRGTAMEYKGIQFEIIEVTSPCCWKWVVFLHATKTRTGIALTRADAMLDAQAAIEEELENRNDA